MGRIPRELRRIIAANIRAERLKKNPGRGGSRRCADTFGVSPQQWSPWELGTRTPDEIHIRQLADFFGVTVEYMRSDHSALEDASGFVPPAPGEPRYPEPSFKGMSCAENEILWQLHKIYSGLATDGQRLHVSLNIVFSKEAKQEALNSPK